MIGLVTYAKLPALSDDDRPLIAELAKLGVDSRPVCWDATVQWSDYQALVLRSPWDYHIRIDEFRRWLAAIEAAGVTLWNPYPVVRWNLHKGYLRELEQRGVVIPPTRWIVRGSGLALSDELRAAGWNDAVIKPAISASATDTFRTGADHASDDARFAALVARQDMMVQRTVPEIADKGEWSLMFIDGAYSHAVIKRPASGDFRVQQELGGSATPAEAPRALVAAAERVVGMIPGRCLYTRIDGVETARGFELMEVEALDALLFFAVCPEACAAMARALENSTRS